MAVFCHLVGTSEKILDFEEFKAFVMDLLHEQFVAMPTAIFVGEARENPDGYYWSTDAAYSAILPNSPGSMIELLEEYEDTSSTVETLRYDGDDETAFSEALSRVPFGEKDICICFDLPADPNIQGKRTSRYGEGVAIFALTHPFPVHYEARKSSFQRDLTHFIVFYTSLGREILHIKPALRPLLERYFGADPLLGESIDW